MGAKGFIGLAQSLGSRLPQDIALVHQIGRDNAIMQQRQEAARQKTISQNNKEWNDLKLEGWEGMDPVLVDAIDNELKVTEDKVAHHYKAANLEGRTLNSDQHSSIKDMQRNLGRHKTKADIWMEKVKQADMIFDEDIHGIYDKDEVKSKIMEYKKSLKKEDGSFDFESFDPEMPEKIIMDSANMNRLGLAKDFWASLEQQVTEVMDTQWDEGILYKEGETFEYQGVLETDEKGRPIPDENGRFIPKVNNDLMLQIRRTHKDYYKELVKESQATGTSIQDLAREDLSPFTKVDKSVTSQKVGDFKMFEDSESKTAKKEQESTNSRFQLLQRMLGHGRMDDPFTLGALSDSSIADVRLNKSAAPSRPPAPGEKPQMGGKELQIDYYDEETNDRGEKKRVIKTRKFDLSSKDATKKAVLQINQMLNNLTGQKVKGESIVQMLDQMEGGGILPGEEGILNDL